jgi:hypothetical protein
MKTVAICISGQFRSFNDCYKSIIKTFIKSNSDYNIKLFICLSKENNRFITIPEEIYQYCGKIKIEEDGKLPDLTTQINKFKSPNLILNQELGAISSYYQLLQIKSSYELMEEYEKEHEIRFDYVVRMRTDIIYESDFDWDISEESITILLGSDWNGYNDKFAIGPRDLMSKYMTRFNFWMSDNDKNISTHNETNLKLWIEFNNINVTRTNLRYNYKKYNDEKNQKIIFLSVSENKVVYQNKSDKELEIMVRIFDRDNSLFGETADKIFYNEKLKIGPGVSLYSLSNKEAKYNKMISIEGKDLYIEHKMN